MSNAHSLTLLVLGNAGILAYCTALKRQLEKIRKHYFPVLCVVQCSLAYVPYFWLLEMDGFYALNRRNLLTNNKITGSSPLSCCRFKAVKFWVGR
jgi:hypothetical protein